MSPHGRAEVGNDGSGQKSVAQTEGTRRHGCFHGNSWKRSTGYVKRSGLQPALGGKREQDDEGESAGSDVTASLTLLQKCVPPVLRSMRKPPDVVDEYTALYGYLGRQLHTEVERLRLQQPA